MPIAKLNCLREIPRKSELGIFLREVRTASKVGTNVIIVKKKCVLLNSYIVLLTSVYLLCSPT